MSKNRNIKKQEIKNVPNSSGFDIEYKKIGVSNIEPIDTFDKIINKSGKWFLYDEMRKNEALVAAFYNLIESSATAEEIFTKPASKPVDKKTAINFKEEEAKYYKELLDTMIDDMEIPMSECLKDWLTMTAYGFSISEILLKKRLGYNPNNPKKDSKYNDGLIGIRKLASRHQKTIVDWTYDNYSRIKSVVQEDPNRYSNKTEIPYSNILHFRTKAYNGNPWGTSLLRSCALSYYNKKHISREQRQRYSRGFVGVPEITYPSYWADTNSPMFSILNEFQTTVKNLRMGQDAGIVRPKIIDPASGKDLVEFRIVTGESSGNESANDIIDREDSYIAIALLADMFIMSKGASVSGSLTQTKMEIFIGFVSMLLSTIVAELNKKLIPMIWRANDFPVQYMPQFDYTRLNKLNATNLVVLLQSIGKTGLLMPDRSMDNALRKIMFGNAVPEISEDDYNRGQQMRETNTVDSLDLPNSEQFNDVFNIEENKDN